MDRSGLRIWTGALSIVAMLLVAAASFCFFEAAGTDDGAAGVDLCLGMIASALGVVLLVDLHDAGRSSVLGRWTSTPATVGVLDPPPRPPLRA